MSSVGRKTSKSENASFNLVPFFIHFQRFRWLRLQLWQSKGALFGFLQSSSWIRYDEIQWGVAESQTRFHWFRTEVGRLVLEFRSRQKILACAAHVHQEIGFHEDIWHEWEERWVIFPIFLSNLTLRCLIELPELSWNKFPVKTTWLTLIPVPS